MLFATDSKGYSAGGFTLTAPPPFNVFQPESLNNLEVGFKSQFHIGSMKARANVSYFYGWYQNKQTTQALLAQVNPPPAPRTLIQTTTNAGAARPHGVDADITVLPTDDLELVLALSYVDAKYTRYDTLNSQGVPISRAGLPFVGVPAWKVAPHVTYYLPVPQSLGTISLNADYTWYSRALMDSNALILDYAPYHSFRPSRKFLDASLKWSNVGGHDGLDVTLYGTNFTQEVGSVNGQGGYSLIGISADAPADPRMWGVRLGYRF